MEVAEGYDATPRRDQAALLRQIFWDRTLLPRPLPPASPPRARTSSWRIVSSPRPPAAASCGAAPCGGAAVGPGGGSAPSGGDLEGAGGRGNDP